MTSLTAEGMIPIAQNVLLENEPNPTYHAQNLESLQTLWANKTARDKLRGQIIPKLMLDSYAPLLKMHLFIRQQKPYDQDPLILFSEGDEPGKLRPWQSEEEKIFFTRGLFNEVDDSVKRLEENTVREPFIDGGEIHKLFDLIFKCANIAPFFPDEVFRLVNSGRESIQRKNFQ